MSEKVQDKPLREGVTLVLMSRQGQRLVHGRSMEVAKHSDRSPIIGLLKFAAMVRVIWLSAAYDDPYADWWLIRIDQSLRDSRSGLDEEVQGLQDCLDKVPAEINMESMALINPTRVPLKFSCPYAFIAAYLLGDYDHFVQRSLSARHIGALSRDESERSIALCGRHIRRAFISASGYRCLGLTRDDVRQNTARGQAAKMRMGTVPADVLASVQEAVHMPLRRGLTAGDNPVLAKVAEVAPASIYMPGPPDEVDAAAPDKS